MDNLCFSEGCEWYVKGVTDKTATQVPLKFKKGLFLRWGLSAAVNSLISTHYGTTTNDWLRKIPLKHKRILISMKAHNINHMGIMGKFQWPE